MENPSIRPTFALLRRAAHLAVAFAVALTTAACASIGVEDGPGSAAQRQLAEGIAHYDRGDYVAAIRTLMKSDEIWRGSLQTQVTARKYVAFSHCLSDRPDVCRQTFTELLRIQPDFRLAAAEAGHPQWGKVFEQARQEAAAGGVTRPTPPMRPTGPTRDSQPLAQALR
jgi:hypothetical protein